MPLLLEITGLAKTTSQAIVKAKHPPSLVPFLVFMRKFMELYGPEIESTNNATHEPVQVMATNIMLILYEGVRSCAKLSPDDDIITSPMFDTLSSCAKKCPIFLLSLSRDSQPIGEVICSSVETAPMTMKSNETEIVLSSIRFLKELVSFI